MPDEQSYGEKQLEIVREVLEDPSLDFEVRQLLEQIETEIIKKIFVNTKESAAAGVTEGVKG